MNFKITIFFLLGLHFVYGNNFKPTSDSLILKKIKADSKFSQLDAKIAFKKTLRSTENIYLKPSYTASYEADSLQAFAKNLFTKGNLKFVEKITGLEELQLPIGLSGHPLRKVSRL